MKILIDGDSCPLIPLIENVAKNNVVPCHIFIDTCRDVDTSYSEVHIVDKGRDSADFAIVNACCPGDIVVTADGGLASMALAKRALVMSPYGFEVTDKVAASMLQRRYLHARVKRTSKHNSSHRAVETRPIKRENTASLLQRLINKSAQKHNKKETNHEGKHGKAQKGKDQQNRHKKED